MKFQWSRFIFLGKCRTSNKKLSKFLIFFAILFQSTASDSDKSCPSDITKWETYDDGTLRVGTKVTCDADEGIRRSFHFSMTPFF